MAIDLPPSHVQDTAPPVEVRQQAAAALTLRDDDTSRHYRIHGAHLIGDRQAIAAALSGSQQPADALLELARRNGVLNVRIAHADRGATQEFWITAEGLAELSAPDPLRPYFDDFVSTDPIHRTPFERARRLAGLHLRRTGYSALTAYEGEGARPHMRIKVRDVRHSNWDYRAHIGNTGNRYLGRWFSTLGAAHVSSNSLRIGTSITSALTALGDNETDASYGRVGVFADRVRPWGIVRLDASYSEARYGDIGSGRRTVLDELIDPQARNQTRNIDLRLGGEHLIGVTSAWSWSLVESLGASDYRRESRDSNQTDEFRERYYHGSIGLIGRWAPPDQASDPVLFLNGRFRQGLASDELTDDAETGFRIVEGGIGAAAGIGKAGRLMAEYRGQYAFNAVPEGEEWVLGGIDRMNAWLPGVLVGDIGFLARAQWRAPEFRFGRLGLEPLLIYEHGQTEFVRRGESGRDIAVIADAAIGLDASLADSNWSLQLRSARPVRSQGRDQAYFDRLRSEVFVQISRAFDG